MQQRWCPVGHRDDYRNKWGIPEPPPTYANAAMPGDIDILVVPGCAFDKVGRRLGHGKGYYDRFISSMRDGNNTHINEGGAGWKKKLLLVGVCLEEQYLQKVPCGLDLGLSDRGIIPVSDHDYGMDVVLTPSKTIIINHAKS